VSPLPQSGGRTYEFQPSFILGFHGCDASTGNRVLAGDGMHLQPSRKDYDWLGHGIYFWEGNPARAMAWAQERQKQGKIKAPFVVGAIIDLRHCLDLFDLQNMREVEMAYSGLKRALRQTGQPLPKNKGETPDKAARYLDCKVMNFLHQSRDEDTGDPSLKFDSVRGAFLEGRRVYPGAGFRRETHIQISVRNTDCIKGYFRPIV